jgi:NAD(P)-dependent dehydrogenase (short-subunit alcohol dehydrogenase family)
LLGNDASLLQDADKTKGFIEKEGRTCLCLPGDITKSDFCTDAVEQTIRHLGKLDILV